MKHLAQLAAIVAIVTALPGPARSGDVFPAEVTTRRLDNGLTVVLVPMESPGIVAYYSIVRVGSRNEVEAGHSGFAHFFEHMMFRGTERYPTEAYNNLFKLLGSDTNAYTSDDVTVYHAVFGGDGLEKVIDAESDRFMNLSYAEADFRQEAKAVLGEYNKNYSNPMRKIHEKLRDTAYSAHTYKHTTMGFIQDIEDMPNQYDYSRTFFQRFYTPSNTTVLIVGDFDADDAWRLIQQYYGPWKKPAYDPLIPVEPEQRKPGSAHIDWDNATLPYLAIAFKVPAFTTGNSDCAAIDILSRVVFDQSSPLYRKLVIDEQTAEFLSGSMPDRRDPGLFYIYARVKDEKEIETVRAAIYGALAEAATTPVDAGRLAAIKSNIRYDFAMSLDTAESVASHLTAYLSLTGDPASLNAAYRRYDEVTAADVRRVAQTYFDRAHSTEVTLTGANKE